MDALSTSLPSTPPKQPENADRVENLFNNSTPEVDSSGDNKQTETNSSGAELVLVVWVDGVSAQIEIKKEMSIRLDKQQTSTYFTKLNFQKNCHTIWVQTTDFDLFGQFRFNAHVKLSVLSHCRCDVIFNLSF